MHGAAWTAAERRGTCDTDAFTDAGYYPGGGLLVVYCLRSISWLSAPHGAPELIAIAAVAGLHLWKRNVLLSIAGGTVLYMVLVQAVFV